MIHSPYSQAMSEPNPLVSNLRNLLLRQPFGPGSRLPSETELGRLLGVSRTLIRPALETLTKEGLIQVLTPKVRTVFGGRLPSAATGVIALVTRFRKGAIEEDYFRMRISVFWGLMSSLSAQLRPVLIQEPGNDTAATVRAIQDIGASGCIILEDAWREDGFGMRELIDALVVARIPCTAHGEILPIDAPLRTTIVASDHARGARMVTEALAQRGVKRVFLQHVNHQEQRWKAARMAGYQRACDDLNIEIIGRSHFPAIHGGKIDMHRLRSQAYSGILLPHISRIDGIIAISDGPVPPIISACQLLGRKPGSDIFIAGYDNYWNLNEEYAYQPMPPSVTIDKRGEAVGDALLTALNRGTTSHPEEILIEPRLVVPT